MEIRSTGNPDINNPTAKLMIDYLAKKGREVKMGGMCKHPVGMCSHMTILGGNVHCDATLCQLTEELPKRTNTDKE